MLRRIPVARRKRKKAKQKNKGTPRRIRLDPTQKSQAGEDFIAFASERIVGQPRLVECGAGIIEQLEAGIGLNKRRPLKSVLVFGPSGSGKTLFAKVLAEYILGDDESTLFRIDCQDYSQPHQIAKLLGAPAGYKDSDEEPYFSQRRLDAPAYERELQSFYDNLSEEKQVRIDAMLPLQTDLKKRLGYLTSLEGSKESKQKIAECKKELKELEREFKEDIGVPGYDPELCRYVSVVLIDEIERAHNDFRELLFRILDEGIVEDARGHSVNFRGSIIVITSNLGSEEVTKALQVKSGEGVTVGFTGGSASFGSSDTELYRYCRDRARQFLGTPLFGRVDQKIFARSLSKESMRCIFNIEMHRLYNSLMEEQFPLLLNISSEVQDKVIEKATKHLEEGARLLRSMFRSLITEKINRLRSTEQILPGDEIEISLDREEIMFHKVSRRDRKKQKIIIIPPLQPV